MDWLQSLDVSLFRFINGTLSNTLFDVLMPFLSGNPFFVPAAILTAALVIWRGKARGLVFVLVLALAVGITDGAVSKPIKEGIARPRPWAALKDVQLHVGRGGKDRSMPSSHAANCFAATAVAFLFYRRSWRFTLPLALGVSFSRIYNGVHFPSDVFVGAILGIGTGTTVSLAVEFSWRWLGPKWFPSVHQRLPSLLKEQVHNTTTFVAATTGPQSDAMWLRGGYLLIAAGTVLRWLYIASDTIDLSGDEAYQWIWSKHLALSYYSKPLMIAVTQWLGTSIWGDTAFGVRFFSPLIAAVAGILLLRFFAREVSARAGFYLMLIITTTPLVTVGATLMTVDPLAALFWIAAMLAGWRALRPDSGMTAWLWTGLWMGLGFLSKYTSPLQWLCWLVFFLLVPEAQKHLRRPGPYLALGVNLLCTLPVLIWNQQNGWAGFEHVVQHTDSGEELKLSLSYLTEFLGSEWALMNPVFFGAIALAMVGLWRTHRRDARMIYIFSMGAPVFAVYLLLSFKQRVLPNWIAPSVLPLLCVMVIYWERRERDGAPWVMRWLGCGVALGGILVTFMLDTNLIGKIIGRPLPVAVDPQTRVRGYRETAKVVEQARQRLKAEGREVFVIANHYSTAGLLTFYTPEARTNVKSAPIVFCPRSDSPQSQFYFWPGYESTQRGHNAIFVHEIRPLRLSSDWFVRWLRGNKELFRARKEDSRPMRFLTAQFESVTNLGPHEIIYRNRVVRSVQIIECRNLR
ncbi:MAG: phosphatase PAP2 family protein [Verrucomicrobia bacterium]|nr:phosphatase PAP2 family protein [Verrucomicrobiota bacterium]